MSGLLELKAKVQGILTDVFNVVRVDKDGDYSIPYESTNVWVRCTEQQREGAEPRTLIHVTSMVLHDVDPTSEFFRFVATHSDDWLFGHISAAEDEDSGKYKVWMRHTLLGDYLDEEELKATVIGICSSADQLDDQMKELFGGERFFDDFESTPDE
jgi:hypothetical protein